MEDTTNPGTDLEVGTTTNVADVAETSPATEAVESKEPQTLRDAVLKAFDKTKPAEDKTEAPKTAMPTLDPSKPTVAETTKEIDPISGRELEAIKAPNSMSPALREKWGTVPRQMQQYWIDRERDMSTKLQETAQERKLAQEFREVAAPYEAMLRQHNTTAAAHAKELFNLSHSLLTGTPQHKAQVFASMLNHYKPDPAALQAALAGQPVQAMNTAPKQVDISAEVERTIAARETKRMEAEAVSLAESFSRDPKNEFFEDVKGLMQKGIEAGLVNPNQPVNTMLKEAYDWACQQHPEVRGILTTRTQVAAPVAATAIAKPVGSVKPSLGTGNRSGTAKPMSLREATLAAWDKHQR